MENRSSHAEPHRSHRSGWLRAAVLGANDGIVSTASLVIGVASAQASHDSVLIAGVAGVVAGAMSMAAGEYVSVSSQSDTEKADLEREKKELELNEGREIRELALIYEERGLEKELAHEVAVQLMAHDALGAHARDEIGISDIMTARPLQAAWYSAASFTAGGLLPLLAVLATPQGSTVFAVALVALLSLTGLGVVSARIGGAPVWIAAGRVTFWGALAMALTAAVGRWFGGIV
ncbi:MAG: VIT family protein [Xanthomonadales bacterium]|nr:VIT family protein [Xanthomonadales bacterium]